MNVKYLNIYFGTNVLLKFMLRIFQKAKVALRKYSVNIKLRNKKNRLQKPYHEKLSEKD